MHLIGVVLVGVLTVSPVAPTNPGLQASLDEMTKNGAPGVVAQLRDGGRTWTGRSGVGDLDRGTPVPLNARFRAGSVTKSLVAAVVLQLVGEGRLGLDQPVLDDITVRALLNNTSGLPDYLSDPVFADPRVYGKRTFTPDELIEIALRHKRGTGWKYSNTNYVVLGRLVERTTGEPLGEELARRVLRPAGMRSTFLPATFPRIPGPHATGYYLHGDITHNPDPQPQLQPLTEINPSFAWAAYGLVSTTDDLQRFYDALLSGKLLPAALLKEMQQTVPTGNPAFPGYGLGLERVDLTCGAAWGHTGSIPGYMTFAFAREDGRRQFTFSINAQVLDRSSGRFLAPGFAALEKALCPVSAGRT
ncbi:serine hydrolase domain-containing protein [Allokutzneria albata]|uniref:D-alanyl-D-alanine carboxypeptidase n=1 Tax=Allokutzneria albata TaxID=211114 RepID=A0A1G9ZNA0_ALLAB|nr:serine hydrolase domain-containing protein [Allokutzneria albata]SDN22962.1 D-alanyl-D-alanine carboxypeptidase [Allokutzneria albata]